MGPTFERLRKVLERDNNGLSLRNDPSSIAPERALVLEVAGSITNFHGLVRHVNGLKFLAEEEFEFEPNEDFFEFDTRKGHEKQRRTDRRIAGRLYLSMPDVKALHQLLSLWKKWKRDGELPRKFTRWRELFENLRTIRAWGPADRIADDTVSIGSKEIANSREMCRIEIEMWFHDNARDRKTAYQRVTDATSKAGGKIVDHTVIENIRYEAVLIDVPSSEITRLAAREKIHLVICDDVMFLRPQLARDIPMPGEETGSDPGIPENRGELSVPVAALLDGVPIQNHALLEGRMEMDDPDDLEAMSVVVNRHHVLFPTLFRRKGVVFPCLFRAASPASDMAYPVVSG